MRVKADGSNGGSAPRRGPEPGAPAMHQALSSCRTRVSSSVCTTTLKGLFLVQYMPVSYTSKLSRLSKLSTVVNLSNR